MSGEEAARPLAFDTIFLRQTMLPYVSLSPITANVAWSYHLRATMLGRDCRGGCSAPLSKQNLNLLANRSSHP